MNLWMRHRRIDTAAQAQCALWGGRLLPRLAPFSLVLGRAADKPSFARALAIRNGRRRAVGISVEFIRKTQHRTAASCLASARLRDGGQAEPCQAEPCQAEPSRTPGRPSHANITLPASRLRRRGLHNRPPTTPASPTAAANKCPPWASRLPPSSVPPFSLHVSSAVLRSHPRPRPRMLSQISRAMQQTTGASNQEQHLRAQLELLQNHDADTSSAPGPRDARAVPSRSPSSRPANGYDHLSAASHDVVRAVATKTEPEAHIHPDLRGPPSHGAPTPNMMPMAPPSGHSPASAPASASPTSPMDIDGSPDGRKVKRELSQSKRAAQNRAAQRAFRQRKEGYIKKLEQQVREYNDMEQTFKAMQSENYALREYVIHLQSRLLDVQGEFPQPPPNINLSPPPPPPPPPSSGPEQTPSNPGAGTPLEAVAQAVAGLAAQEQMAENLSPYANRREEDTRTAEEINRQLKTEEGTTRL
ncbi:transcription factor kapC [Tolypocladium capitatum]|uniref:Putative transcription factor kapC n=1 Tax=Tolypocladium capitatum TaxID=45235 RepID=A0A2K3QP01_9HYPO|nr:transcription factor kapC [Tolypocladium capitatum]